LNGAGGKKQNWKNLFQCSYQPFTISTYQKYPEYREQIPKINHQIQTLHSVRPLQPQIKQEGQSSIPQQIQNTIPIIQQTPTHPLPSSNQVFQQQLQIKPINTSTQLQRSNQNWSNYSWESTNNARNWKSNPNICTNKTTNTTNSLPTIFSNHPIK
ncbi:hypothetical protein ENUP19_0220G0007, partial [Entamoeba nuttalli]